MTPSDHDAALRAVSSAVLAVTRHLSVHEVLEVVVRSARRLLRARYGALGVPDDQGGFAEFVADGIPKSQWDEIGELPRQHGMLAGMLESAEPVRLADIREDPRFGWWPRAHPVLKDFLGVPIKNGGELLGILFLANKDGGFTEDDQSLLELFAAHAAIGLTNARLYERSREYALIEERTRVAHDLHDAVTQKLFSLRLTAQAASALLERDPTRATAELKRVEALAGEALAELRAVIVELRPAELDRHGLVETLRQQVRVLDRLHEIDVEFAADGEIELTPECETTVLRIAQEALNNAVRHSGGSTVSVRLRVRDGLVVLEVADDGSGFDVDEARRRGLGLASMADRARSAGGRLTVSTDDGTTVRLEVPA